jgi:tripartite-type tricarboxylate transporter receptor subunit TctC
VLRLNEVVNRIVNLADVKERLAADAILTVGGTPEAFGSKMKIEMARWGQVVKDTGAKAD